MPDYTEVAVLDGTGGCAFTFVEDVADKLDDTQYRFINDYQDDEIKVVFEEDDG